MKVRQSLGSRLGGGCVKERSVAETGMAEARALDLDEGAARTASAKLVALVDEIVFPLDGGLVHLSKIFIRGLMPDFDEEQRLMKSGVVRVIEECADRVDFPFFTDARAETRVELAGTSRNSSSGRMSNGGDAV